MNNNKGFIISTTLYSVFIIMLITVASILYILSSKRATMAAMTDKVKMCIEECNTPENICDGVFKDTNPCSSGKESTLECKILGNNYENVTNTAPGLFQGGYNFYSDVYRTIYYYSGNVENNYFDLAGKLTRIVRINEDGSIKVIEENNQGNSVFNRAIYYGSDSMNYGRYINLDGTTEGTLAEQIRGSSEVMGNREFLIPTIFCGNTPGTKPNNVFYENGYCPPNSIIDYSMWGILNAGEVNMSYGEGYSYLSSGGAFWTLTTDISYRSDVEGFVDPATGDAACPNTIVAEGNVLYFDGTKLVNKNPTTAGKYRTVYSLKPNLTVAGIGTKDDPYYVTK